MTQLAPIVFLLDVDNTLLDNDRIEADLKRDGDVVFQPRKIERSGLFQAVEDITIECIGDLLRYDLTALLPSDRVGVP